MKRLQYNTTTVNEVLECVVNDGYALIENVADEQTLAAIKSELSPLLKNTTENNPEPFLGDHTKRFGRLVYRMPSTHPIIQHPLAMHVCEDTIGKYACSFRLSFTGIMHVMAGQKAQSLHRDITPFPSPAPTMAIATMWAITDFTRENGATVFAPGSHKWNNERKPKRKELTCAEMPAGSVLIYDAALIHGAGKCVTGERTGLSLQYKVGWLRQEENQYLATPLEFAKTLPESMQRLIGYDLAARHWGAVDQQHPLDFLNGDNRVGTLELPGYDYENRVVELEAKERGLSTKTRFDVTLDNE